MTLPVCLAAFAAALLLSTAVFAETPSEPAAAGGLPANAVAALDVVPGLEATLFAAEPMLLEPFEYRRRSPGPRLGLRSRQLSPPQRQRPEGDRILILEDTDHDGRADKSTSSTRAATSIRHWAFACSATR